MKAKYEVLSDWKPGDGITTLRTSRKEDAFRKAKSDTKGEFKESHVYQYDEGDVVGHWIFENGRQKHIMY